MEAEAEQSLRLRSRRKQSRQPTTLKPEVEAVVEAEQLAEAGEEADAVGGVGAVEGDEVVEAEEAAPEVHEVAVESR